LSQISKRYAKALFVLANQHNDLDSVSRDFKKLQDLISRSTSLQFLLKMPLLNNMHCMDALNEISRKLNFCPLMVNLLKLMALKKRLKFISEVGVNFEEYVLSAQNKVKVDIISAVSLNKIQLKKLTSILSKQWNKEIYLFVTISPHLIDGFIIKCGSQVIDFSLNTQLENLKRSLKGD